MYTHTEDVETVIKLNAHNFKSTMAEQEKKKSDTKIINHESSGKEKKSSSTSTPIYKSIEYLDRKGMEVLSTGSIDEWDEYISKTKNTICGRKPLSVLLNCLDKSSRERLPMNGFKSSEERDSWGKLKWIGYAQSSQARELRESSVSYSSGYAVI